MSIFHRSHPEAAGPVIDAPNPPVGSTDTIPSRYVDTGDVGSDVRPFRAEIPEAELAELRRRIEGTR